MTVEGTDSRADPVPDGRGAAQQRRPPVLSSFARLSLNTLLMAAGTALVVWSLVQLRLVVVPALVAVLLATLLVPPADALRRRRLPSIVATAAVLGASAALLAAVVALIAPAMVDQLDDVGRSAQEASTRRSLGLRRAPWASNALRSIRPLTVRSRG